MIKQHANHGGDHRPPKYGTTQEGGGTDPIRGMLYLPSDAETDGQVLTRASTSDHGIAWADAGSGSSVEYGTHKHTMYGREWEQISDAAYWASNAGSWNFVADSAAHPMGGGYMEWSGGNATSDPFRLWMGLPLSPIGSAWAVSVWYFQDTDQGRFSVEWATTSNDEIGATGLGSTTSVVDPFYTPATWYRANNPGAGAWSSADGGDCYGVTPGWQRVTGIARIALTGAEGAQLAGDGAAPTGDWSSPQMMNAGAAPSVQWWLSLRVNGKNASSSGYGLKIGGVQVFRRNDANAWFA